MRKTVIALMTAALVVATVSPSMAEESDAGDACQGLLGCDPAVLPPNPDPDPRPSDPSSTDTTLENRAHFTYSLSLTSSTPGVVGQAVNFVMDAAVSSEDPKDVAPYRVVASNNLDKIMVVAGAL